MPDTVDIKGAEIFEAGDYGAKGAYTADDLDEMVANFDALKDKVKPFVKLGHSETQGLLQADGYPAGGWITSLRRVGTKLVADIAQVPRKLADLVKAGAYKRVSSEIYPTFADGGKQFGKVLRAVAFLGSDMPQVKTLDDLRALFGEPAFAPYSADDTADQVEYDYFGEVREVLDLFAEWSTAFINSLPDSSFAVVEPAYKSGKTADKNARHLPYKDASGKVDLPHLRNALARANQITPVTDSITAQELRRQALTALNRAAKAAGIGGRTDMHEGDDDMADEAKIAELEAQLNKYKADAERATTLEQQLATAKAEARVRDAKAFIEAQKHEGRVLPKHEAQLVALMTALDDEQTITFAENGKQVSQKPAEMLRAYVEGLPKLIEFRETSDGEGKGDEVGDDPAQQFVDAAEARAKKDEIGFAEAARLIAAENPQLFEAYDKAFAS
ncbi:MAG TPA: hypothetical protein VFK80_02860 [Limnochordia bacterium]|nr:hypothetical protein [Limnochordia bacterium]